MMRGVVRNISGLYSDLGYWFILKQQKANKLLRNDKHDKRSHEHGGHSEGSGAREYWQWEDVWLVNDGAEVKRETQNWILENNKKQTISITVVIINCSCYTSFVCRIKHNWLKIACFVNMRCKFQMNVSYLNQQSTFRSQYQITTTNNNVITTTQSNFK